MNNVHRDEPSRFHLHLQLRLPEAFNNSGTSTRVGEVTCVFVVEENSNGFACNCECRVQPLRE